ncbi:AI-2E family transporter [Actinomadura rifamycini]|uniref:AI-2E family transporter n=1 Tax=Actinomadura rifamycini TaxID=31962 RepID=UPI0004799A54|nr:AI-2E family transporter [Actinomadura rifamycini]
MPDETPREDGSAAPPGPAQVPAPTPPPDDTAGTTAGTPARDEPDTEQDDAGTTGEPATVNEQATTVPDSSATDGDGDGDATDAEPSPAEPSTGEAPASADAGADTEASASTDPTDDDAPASGDGGKPDTDGKEGAAQSGPTETRPQDTDVLDAPPSPSPPPPGDGEPAAEPAEPAAGLAKAGGALAAEQGAPVQVTPDPAMDVEQRRREAGVDQRFPFGRPGQPLGRHHPFVFGFTAALGVITAWMLVQAATSARSTIVMIVVALFLAIGLNPAVERLRRIGLPRGLAVGAVFFGVLLFFAGFVASLVQPVTEQVNELRESIPQFVEQLQNNDQLVEWDKRYGLLERAETFVNGEDFQKQVTDAATGIGRVAINGVVQTVTILILTLYFLGSLPQIKTFFYKLAPRTRRARVALLGDEILDRIGGYVAGQFMIGFIAGAASYVFLSIVGVKYALALSLIVAVTALIPLVGATIGAVVVCLIAFLTGSLTDVIACVVFYVAYQQVENYLIYPRVMKRTVDVQPAVTIVAALVGAALLGVVGALLAIPTAAAVSLLIREVVLPRQETL